MLASQARMTSPGSGPAPFGVLQERWQGRLGTHSGAWRFSRRPYLAVATVSRFWRRLPLQGRCRRRHATRVRSRSAGGLAPQLVTPRQRTDETASDAARHSWPGPQKNARFAIFRREMSGAGHVAVAAALQRLIPGTSQCRRS